MLPLTVTSSRKLIEFTASPDCDCVCAMSLEFTTRFPLVSPINTFIEVETLGLKLPAESATLLKLIVNV